MNAHNSTLYPLAWCRDRFGINRVEAVLDLACHAALPVALNSELLHLIRINFFYSHTALDYTSEAELLLSPLCREVGQDLYELLPDARVELLRRLYSRYPGRIVKLSTLISHYAKSCADWLHMETLQRSQVLTGLLHLDRACVKSLLAAQEGRINPTQAREEHEWLLAMRKEVELGEAAASARTPEFFFVHRLLSASPWQERPELAQLRAWWRENQQGLCMFTGAANTGKTALAERFVQSLTSVSVKDSAAFREAGLPIPKALLVYSFHDSPDIDGFFENIGAWLGLQHTSSRLQQVPYREIRDRLSERGGLLILDGLDSIQDSSEWGRIPGQVTDWRLADLLQRIARGELSGTAAVLTSRYPLPEEDYQPGYRHLTLQKPFDKYTQIFHDTLRDGNLGPEMVLLPAGTFTMGDDKSGRKEEQPAHEVTLGIFAIGKYPVTVGEFRQFVALSGYRTEAETGDGAYVVRKGVNKIKDANWHNPYFEQSDEHPVVCISWNDAQTYCKWLCEQTGKDYRLLTEAQWEYACRAGSSTSYCFGNDEKLLGDYAWYNKNSGQQTHPVGRSPQTPGACMTCMGMSGSGCRTGMGRTRKMLSKIRLAPSRAPAGCFAAVAGRTAPASAVRRTVASGDPATATATWAFALRGKVNLSTLTLLPLAIKRRQPVRQRKMSFGVMKWGKRSRTGLRMARKRRKWCICRGGRLVWGIARE